MDGLRDRVGFSCYISQHKDMKKAYLLVAILLAATPGRAQQQSWPIHVSVFSNATLPPPGILTRVFAEPLHPGLSLGTAYTYRNNGTHELLQTLKAGYFYHRYSQQAIQLYTEIGYRLHTRAGLALGLLVGGGYLHAIPTTQTFEWNGQAGYARKTNSGRLRALVSTTVEVGYTTLVRTHTPVRFFLGYQCWLQFPFVKQYVPVLPNTALHVGVNIPLRKPPLRNGTK